MSWGEDRKTSEPSQGSRSNGTYPNGAYTNGTSSNVDHSGTGPSFQTARRATLSSAGGISIHTILSGNTETTHEGTVWYISSNVPAGDAAALDQATFDQVVIGEEAPASGDSTASVGIWAYSVT
jgi:hypothetical protein